MSKAPVVIDLFCGCGGFGLGAKLAGFDVIAAVDIDATLQSAYARNFPNTKIINGDI
ncbi:TPA: DNA cytosine methyltransferase, partial [Escherichia coli]